MDFKFSKDIQELLIIIAKNAQFQGNRVFFVGGLVRDKLLNLPVKDIDLIVDCNSIDFIKKIDETRIKIKSIHKDFATIKIIFKDLEIDIASTRKEKYPSSGCLPIIEKTGIKIQEDVLRRDFTINSIYCEIIYENEVLTYKIIDPTNGITDIKNKTLRVLHNNSYFDDPTRILRGIDFKYRFDFDFSSEDKKLIDNYIKNYNLTSASTDRIKQVLKKTLKNKQHFQVFEEITNIGFQKMLFNNFEYINYEKIKEIISILKLNLKEVSEFYYKIIENKEIEKLNFSLKTDIFNCFNKLNNEEIAYYTYKTNIEILNIYLNTKNNAPLLKGNDLIEAGYKQGKIIGIILFELLKTKLNSPETLKTKEDELKWVKRNFPYNKDI